MRRAAIGVTVLLLFVVPVMAFDTTKLGQAGSVPLDDLTALIATAPKLKIEIDDALAKAGKKSDEVICTGMRFPGSWKELGGARVAPYACQLGDKWLQLRARVKLTGKGGKVFERADKDAMRRAEKAQETNLVWTWSDKEPSEP